MRAEPGDRSVQVTRADVSAALRSVGVVEGDTVMFHSSLSSMGTVVGGPETVIEGFLDAVGPTGTVAVPTLCNWTPEEQHLVFERWDPRTSPSYVGAITEAFRKRPDALRSDHATHSVAAIGARAAELTANHGASGPRLCPYSSTAFAHESPWEKFRLWNAAYCFIGVSFHVNTMVHYVESLIVERALERADPAAREELADQVRGWMNPGVWPGISTDGRDRIEALLAAEGAVRYGKIGSATLRCARAGVMVKRWLEVAEADPEWWFNSDFVQWLRRARPGGEQ